MKKINNYAIIYQTFSYYNNNDYFHIFIYQAIKIINKKYY